MTGSPAAVRRWLVAVGILLALGEPAVAQEPTAETSREPAAIPVPAVAERADELVRQLRQVRTRLAPLAEVETVAKLLDDRRKTIALQRDATLAEIQQRPALSRLGALERDWARLAEEFSGWRRTLTRRAGALEADVEALRTAEELWQRTDAGARAASAPRELLDAIARSTGAIREVRRDVAGRRSEVLALQNRVAQQELVVSETLDAVREERASFRGRLLEPQEQPIWALIGAADAEVGDEIGVAAAASLGSMRTFVEERRQRLWLLGLVFVLAWLAARGLERSVAVRRAAGGEIDARTAVFRHPVTVALLTALLSCYWLFPLAPEVVFDAVGLLLLVPMLRLLPDLVHPGFRPILYGIAGFYVVDRLRDMLEGAVLGGRLMFAAECAAALGFCLVLMRPARLAKVPDPERFPRWIAPFVRVTAAVFGVALVANLLGYVSLSRVLGDGVLTSIYLAVVLFAAARVASIVFDATTKTAWAQKLHVLRTSRLRAVAWIDRGIDLGAAVLWAYWSLAAFAIRDPVLETLGMLLSASLEVGEVSLSLGDAVIFAVTITAALLVARLGREVVKEDVFARLPTARGVPHAAGATVYYLLLVGGVLFAFAAAGVDFGRFTLLAGALGVGLGFGLQNIVNNFVSGIVLLYERPVQVGDTIDMGDLLGTVKRIGIRSSTVRSFSGAEVIVPNADLISNRVINWTLSDRNRRVDIAIGVRYGTDPERVREILLEIAAAHPRVLAHPAPVALFRSHGESSLDFELRAWVPNIDDWFPIESELNVAVNRALAEAGIEIPFPQRDLHLRSVDADAARRLAGSEDAS